MKSKGFGSFESLHNHTVISDGEQTHSEVLASAEQYGFGYIAFTDHDIIPDTKIIQLLKQYSGSVKWEVGIEITSGLPIEIGGGAAPLFHLLGLRIDHTNRALLDYCDEAQAARIERLERTVANLKKAGFTIESDECIQLAGEGSVGSPHISRVLLNDETNLRRLELIAEDMREKAQEEPSLMRKYEAMILKVRTGQRHPYIRDLLFADDAYLPDVYVPYLFSLDMDKTVQLIRRAGGLAIMAHWPTVRELIHPDLLESIASNGRIDGIELRSVFNADPDQVGKDMKYLGGVASRNGLIATAGIDGHSAEDFKAFSEIPGALDLTVGQIDKTNS